MGETKATQENIKDELDRKLVLSRPSRELLEELALTAAKEQSPQATFQYAFALSKSAEKSELRYAVTILDGLVKEGYEFQVDCMYGAATALYLLGDYDEARARCEAILRTQPKSRIAKELHLACIEAHERSEKKKMKKAAMASAGVAAAIGVAAGLASIMLKK
uniref:Mitochondrial fission 1 protein n=1 Tax=Entomoneis paludosa TaxID=265537 RepID=A0A7S2YE06_9STRA|mmetsp:Transcript_28981/g.60607  ORF Transcript_28981/g.60607 Transcript_28981/m.60607 type:complete len:163 (+) Transcript_28981:71-559(+)